MLRISLDTINLLATAGDKHAKAVSFYAQESRSEIRCYVDTHGYLVANPSSALCWRSQTLRQQYGV